MARLTKETLLSTEMSAVAFLATAGFGNQHGLDLMTGNDIN